MHKTTGLGVKSWKSNVVEDNGESLTAQALNGFAKWSVCAHAEGETCECRLGGGRKTYRVARAPEKPLNSELRALVYL
jgi:hypothetical protein